MIIELDGHEFHSTRQQRTHDAIRQRELQRLGYVVVRFTGSEIYADVNACVKEAEEHLSLLPIHEDSLPTKDRVRYCVRMKEVVTHLLEKFGRDVNEPHFALELFLSDHHDHLFIEKDDRTISMAHFYIPKEGVLIPDPGVTFIPVRLGGEHYEEWAPIFLGQVMPHKKFYKENDQGKIVITDYHAQHEATELVENWAQVIRLQGWPKNAIEVLRPAEAGGKP